MCDGRISEFAELMLRKTAFLLLAVVIERARISSFLSQKFLKKD